MIRINPTDIKKGDFVKIKLYRGESVSTPQSIFIQNNTNELFKIIRYDELSIYIELEINDPKYIDNDFIHPDRKNYLLFKDRVYEAYREIEEEEIILI